MNCKKPCVRLKKCGGSRVSLIQTSVTSLFGISVHFTGVGGKASFHDCYMVNVRYSVSSTCHLLCERVRVESADLQPLLLEGGVKL